MVTVMLNQKLVGTRKSYETIGGRGFMSQKVKLRNWKIIFTVIVVVFEFIIAVLPLALLIYSTFMLRTGDYSLSNFTPAHWIGQGDIKINSGEPGVLLNPRIWLGRLELHQVVIVDCIIYCIFWSDPWLCDRQRARYQALKACRANVFIPTSSQVLLSARSTFRCSPNRWARSPHLRNICPAGGCIGGEAYTLLSAQRCFCNVTGE